MNLKCLEISKQKTNGFFLSFLVFKYSKFEFVEEQKLNFGFFIAAPKFNYFVSNFKRRRERANKDLKMKLFFSL